MYVQLVFLNLDALVFNFDSVQSIKNSEKEKAAQDVFNKDVKMSDGKITDGKITDGKITDDVFVLFPIYSLLSYINTIIVKIRLFF